MPEQHVRVPGRIFGGCVDGDVHAELFEQLHESADDERDFELAQVFAGPGFDVLMSQYGFAVYAIAAAAVGASVVQAPNSAGMLVAMMENEANMNTPIEGSLSMASPAINRANSAKSTLAPTTAARK